MIFYLEIILKLIKWKLLMIKDIEIKFFQMGIGDWGLGIGDWAQSPIPNPQSPIPIFIIYLIY